MNSRYFILAALCILPWLYLGADLYFDYVSRMNGFGLIPFFGLLLFKETVFNPPGNQKEWTLIPNTYLKYTLICILAVLLTLAVVLVSDWFRELLDVYGGTWFWFLVVLIVSAFISWDLKRVYKMYGASP